MTWLCEWCIGKAVMLVSSFGSIPRGGRAGSHGTCVFSVRGTSLLISTVARLIHIPPPVCEGCFLPHIPDNISWFCILDGSL
jgi:hypothetical protein